MNMFSVSRDTLNPLLNTQKLKDRLETIEHYRYKHGKMYARWPHYVLDKMGRHLYRYKFNYAVKGFAAFLILQEYSQYKHMNSVAILSVQQDMKFFISVTGKAAAFGGICMLIWGDDYLWDKNKMV